MINRFSKTEALWCSSCISISATEETNNLASKNIRYYRFASKKCYWDLKPLLSSFFGNRKVDAEWCLLERRNSNLMLNVSEKTLFFYFKLQKSGFQLSRNLKIFSHIKSLNLRCLCVFICILSDHIFEIHLTLKKGWSMEIKTLIEGEFKINCLQSLVDHFKKKVVIESTILIVLLSIAIML